MGEFPAVLANLFARIVTHEAMADKMFELADKLNTLEPDDPEYVRTRRRVIWYMMRTGFSDAEIRSCFEDEAPPSDELETIRLYTTGPPG